MSQCVTCILLAHAQTQDRIETAVATLGGTSLCQFHVVHKRAPLPSLPLPTKA